LKFIRKIGSPTDDDGILARFSLLLLFSQSSGATVSQGVLGMKDPALPVMRAVPSAPGTYAGSPV
jgi:hypothetical protein